MSFEPARVAVVSPHLDDAVLSAWLVLRRSPRARVITCFAGLPGEAAVGNWDSVAGGSAGRSAVETRHMEDLRALARTDSEPVHLELLDVQYRGPLEEGGLSQRLTSQLESHLRNAEEVWIPAGLGNHVDHVMARQAAIAATSGHNRRYLYADLPYGGQPAWPVDVTGGLRDAAVHVAARGLRTPTPSSQWRSALTAIPGVSCESIRVQRLTPAQRRVKYAAVSEYQSQLPALRCARRNVLRLRRIFAYEVFWTLS
jgi:LmbE family N-acetylglucosaminyl deacetylase